MKRTELKKFYEEPLPEGSCDINSKNFNKDVYFQMIVKERSLKQLLEEESVLVNEIQRLDSDCQTLVYDHYDKFIAATDIVRQMKEGSEQMSAQISCLQENMSKITESSQTITQDLQSRRDKLSHQLGIHSTLRKLQFLFQLPQKIDECIAEKKFAEGVRCYVETSEVLQRYQHLPSFSAIHHDCQTALKKLNQTLKEQLGEKEASAKHLALCVDLLRQLGEPAITLCTEFLSHAKEKLSADLKLIESLAQDPNSSYPKSNDLERDAIGTIENSEDTRSPMSIVEFIDICHNTFVGNLWLVISAYKEMFLRPEEKKPSDTIAVEKLSAFVCILIEEYVAIVGVRVSLEDQDCQGNYFALTTALDNFHRRLHAITQLLPDADFSNKSLELIHEAAESRADASLAWLKESFALHLTGVRDALAAPKQLTQDQTASAFLNELLTKLVATTASNIKDRVTALMSFTQSKHTFALRPDFRNTISRTLIREKMVVGFFFHLNKILLSYATRVECKDPSLLLLLSRMCLDLYTSTIHYLLSHCDDQLQLEDKTGLTPLSNITTALKETGQQLLNKYVSVQGTIVTQMLRRSIELKDWLGCSEPRSVRRVMKTVRDEIAAMDTQVGALYEEGYKKDPSSDSSRRTFHSMSTSRLGGNTSKSTGWSNYSSPLESSSLMANLNKLWSERIEIFAPVQFTRVAILTGIIKIGLKTLLESVRVRTFSRFGFQQMQVDTHYLRTYLWSYVADERILNVLLDEVISSCGLRCTHPELMEQKIVEFICEQT